MLTALLFAGAAAPVTAQTLNGNAIQAGPGCIQLTNSSPWQVGSFFFPDTLNLNRPFNMLLDLNFGNRDLNGADGMVFILQNNSPNEIRAAGGSLGYQYMFNSLGIEFDTYMNAPESDPAYDHIAIMGEGNISHTSAFNLAGPVAAIPGSGNIEDGQNHLAQINWNPANYTLQVYFDCEFRLQLTIDLVGTVFGGDSLVYWGMSAASGGDYNSHSVCILPQEMDGTMDTVLVCRGDTATLTSQLAQNGLYDWAPAYNSSGTTSSLQIWPAQDTLYTVSYRNSCGFSTQDSFWVKLVDAPEPMLGPDSTLCEGNSLVLDPGTSAGNHLWNTGSTATTLTVTTTDLYTVQVTDSAGCVGTDSQYVEFIPVPLVSAGSDTTFCGTDSSFVLLALPVLPNANYVWSNGDSGQLTTVTTTGFYSVTASNAFCSASDTVYIGFFDLPAAELGNDTTVCTGTAYELDPGSPGSSFLWSDGSTGSTLLVDTAGLYTVQVTDSGGCTVLDTQFVDFVDPPVVATVEDITICGAEVEELLVAAPILPGVQYVWSTGDSSSEIMANAPGVYVISAINGCSTATDTVEIIFFRYEEGYFIPNVFSPNGDGINDVFRVENFRPEEFVLEIYDRWGRVMFQTTNHNDTWDGTFSGKPVPAGTYYYRIRTKDCQGYYAREQGPITLVR